MKRVLVLGSGLVARPLVRHMLGKRYKVVVATLEVGRAEEMVSAHPNGRVVRLDVQNEQLLASALDECDLAVSLLPFAMHPAVAKLCIARRRPMVTTSYVSPTMQALDKEACEAGVAVLNEIGVDPGFDHMSAMSIIDDVHRRNGRITAFRSYCGGLPAPEVNDNPLGYKFSWAPRGVLLAARNQARYLLDGRTVEVPQNRLFRDMHLLAVEGLGDFEAYPNRDAIGYREIYGLTEIGTIYRGTLRNIGWCDCLFNFGKLGLLSLTEVPVGGKTYAGFMRDLIDCGPEEDVVEVTAAKLGIPKASLPVLSLEWLGMFSERRFTSDSTTPMDALGALMYEKLAFRPGERDLLVMHHDFRAEYSDGRRERIVSELIDFGIPDGDSAMSRTVSLPAAIAADLILQGRILATGVLRPVSQEIYRPVLDELAELGIACREKIEAY